MYDEEKVLLFYRAFYNLVAIANWEVKKHYSDKVILVNKSKLFDCNTEKWLPTTNNNLVLNRDLTFEIMGKLSLYDIEVLDGCKFNKIETL